MKPLSKASPAMLEYLGRRFGRLHIQGVCRLKNRIRLFAVCSCGKRKLIDKSDVRSGKTVSCGSCYIKYLKHNLSNTHEYQVWSQMQQRCYNPKHKNYHNYGARNIQICSRYKEFASFFADLGNRPEGMTIDREDNDRSYTCGACEECQAKGWTKNVRWVTVKQSIRNRRVTIKVDYKGEAYALADLFDLLNIPMTEYDRISRKAKRQGFNIIDEISAEKLID